MLFYLIVILAVIYFGVRLVGVRKWSAASGRLHSTLEAERRSPSPAKFDPAELRDAPAPVQRYFRKVLEEGQHIITSAVIEQSGSINMAQQGERWCSFTARQYVIPARPGFVWNARVAFMRGIPAYVHDAYAAGDGLLKAALFGLIPVTEMKGTRDAAEGELYRFLAEAPWYPTALLPSQGVKWEAADDSSARATLTDGGISVTMLFRFNEENLIESARAEERGREVNGNIVYTPWEGTMKSYETRGEMLIPTEGEVAWILPEGRTPYWRGRLLGTRYEFAAD
jgi:hypothetical protein